MTELEKGVAYIIYKIGAEHFAISGRTGEIIHRGMDADTVINAAISSANAVGGGIVLLKKGTYIINNGIKLKDNITLKGEGFSTLITLADDTDDTAISNIDHDDGNSNLCVRDLKVDGNRANQTLGYDGILFAKVTNGLIENCWVTQCFANAIVVNKGATDIIIRSCIAEYSIVGIKIHAYENTSCHRILITRCIARYSHTYHGIHCHGYAAAKNYDIIVDHCISHSNVSDDGILMEYTDRFVITGCIFRDNGTFNGIDIVGSNYGAIINNVCYNNDDCGIIIGDPLIAGSNQIIVEGNVCWDNGGYGILANSNTNSDRNIIHGNVVYNNNRGITLGSTCDNSICNDNVVWGNTLSQIENLGAGNIVTDNKA